MVLKNASAAAGMQDWVPAGAAELGDSIPNDISAMWFSRAAKMLMVWVGKHGLVVSAERFWPKDHSGIRAESVFLYRASPEVMFAANRFIVISGFIDMNRNR